MELSKNTVFPSARALLEAGISCREPGGHGWAIYFMEGGAEITLYPGDEGPQEASSIDEVLEWIGGDQPCVLTQASLRRFNGAKYCDVCGDEVPNHEALQVHMERRHQIRTLKEVGPERTCAICGKCFSDFRALNGHMNAHVHKEPEPVKTVETTLEDKINTLGAKLDHVILVNKLWNGI